jgi:hypothetical protein
MHPSHLITWQIVYPLAAEMRNVLVLPLTPRLVFASFLSLSTVLKPPTTI